MGPDEADHRSLSPSMGGELASWLREVAGDQYDCPACGRAIEITAETDVRGYRHADGIPDETGTRWWAYVECPSCGYALTHDQMGEE